MTKTIHKTVKNGQTYYHVMDEQWVDGKPVRKYVAYLGKSPKSKSEIMPSEVIKYVERLLGARLTQEEIDTTLKKMGIEYDAWPITKIVIENDLTLQKVFLKLK